MLLAAATVAFGLGFGINTGTVPSFTAGYLHTPRESLGLLESMREVPGLLTAGIIGLVAAIAEPRLAAGALLFLAVGIGLTGRVPGGLSPGGQPFGFWPLVACNVFWSIGLHVWLTVQPSLTLSLSRAGRYGHGLGLMARYMSLAQMTGLVLVLLLARPLGYATTFAVAGILIAVGSLFAIRIHHGSNVKCERQRDQRDISDEWDRGAPSPQAPAASPSRLVFRAAYWRYYGLMLLDGGRRQIVQTFVVLILVKEFGVQAQGVAFLLLINYGLTMVASPVVGHWTDRFGERRILTVYYALVACVFFAYTQVDGLAHRLGLSPLLFFSAVFALDNLLFTGSVGIQTYIRHQAPPEDLSPSLAMGLTWNHVAAVTVPLAAGWLWQHYGYKRIFLYGVGLALASLVMCRTLPRPREDSNGSSSS